MPSNFDSLAELATLDQACGRFFSRLQALQPAVFEAGKVSIHFQVVGLSAPRLIIVGCGENAPRESETVFRFAGSGAKRAAEKPMSRVALAMPGVETQLWASGLAGAMTGCVGQDIFRNQKNLYPFESLFAVGELPQAELLRGQILGEGIVLARKLVNLPPNYMYPESFVQHAADVAVTCGLELDVWDELRLRRERCDSLLAVAAGSERPPRLLILRYRGQRECAPVALVGKGVTFDSGGLSLKPSDSMITMKCDMAGAATVLATMQTIARLKIAQPVVGVIGLVENMISGQSYKLGDVLTSRSGKTIEIHNTDAEGRLVLADALNVALEEKPCKIIDLATLTGAA